GKTDSIKQLGYAAWVAAAGPDDAFLAASKSKDNLRDFLASIPAVDPAVRGALYEKVEPLIFNLPAHLQAEQGGLDLRANGIHVDYFFPSGPNVALETLAKLKPKASGIVPEIVMNVPQRKQADRFALRFTGVLNAPKSGRYQFFSVSDDGSRIYIGKKLVVNNDGLHGMVEKSGAIDLPAGAHPIIVTYFDNGGGDGLRVTWQGPGFKRQPIPRERLMVSGGESIHDIAVDALGAIPGREVDKFNALSTLIASGKSRAAAIHVLRGVPRDNWPRKKIQPLIDNLIGYLSELPVQYRTSAPAVDAIALAKALASTQSPERRQAIEARLQNLDVRVIAIGTVPHRMIYDKEVIALQAGKPVEFRFSNTDAMPHNFAITQPGALTEVGELAEATGNDPDAMARHYIPKSSRIMLASRLLQPGESQALSFEAPKEPGVYPFVCTYPGHWRRMYGALYVVSDLAAYQADPTAYLAANALPIRDDLLKFAGRSHEWTFEELIGDVKELPMGRSFEVGKELFKVASCSGCHKLDNEGFVFGPDLAKLDEKKKTTEHILRSLVEPSKDIDEKFQSYSFVLASGKIVTGMIVKETPTEIEIVIDPLAKGKPTTIDKDDIEEQKKSKNSLMPKGLLNKLTPEEILDLVAFVFAAGDKKNMLFEQHKH
ncbi:MAG: PA14 domain-containing protein, partial [Pirellulaceae bacterium]|nr:PA14 domain-containing protein [Pirellulaceae bacterium]